MEIKGEEYHIIYNPDTTTVVCSGILRLQGDAEYAPIIQLLSDVADRKPANITLDIQRLQFLNSPGINALSQFVMRVCKQKESRLLIRGACNIPWHSKSFENLKRLMPDLSFEMEWQDAAS